MFPRIVLLFLAVLLVPAFANAGNACCEFCPDQYQQEGQFPYFEVIRTRRLIPTPRSSPRKVGNAFLKVARRCSG